MCDGVVFRVDVSRWVEVLSIVMFCKWCLCKAVRVGVCESFAPANAWAKLVEVSPELAVALSTDGPA